MKLIQFIHGGCLLLSCSGKPVPADKELAERRGQTIIDSLLAHDIAPERLTNQPKVSEKEGVEFEILRRASDEGE